MSKKHIFGIILLSLILAPIYKFLTQTKFFHSVKNLNHERCDILEFDSHFIGLEDITKVFEDEHFADFIGGYEPRLTSWMNHSFKNTNPSTLKRGFAHIHVDKKKCRQENQEKRDRKKTAPKCVSVKEVDSIKLKDPSILFNPHGMWFDETKQQLYVLSHGWKFGGDHYDVFDITREVAAISSQGGDGAPSFASSVVVKAKHSHSISHAVGAFPSQEQIDAPFNWLLPLTSGVAPPSSAYGVLNDLTIDRANNRIIVTQWKPYPSPHYFPDAQKWQDKHAQLVIGVLGDATFILTCPMTSSTSSEVDSNQCIRSRQRFGLANGIVSNRAGSMFIVSDLIHYKLVFLTANKIDTSSSSSFNAETFDPFVTLGKFTSEVAGDNLDVSSENSTHICITSGGHQRLVEVAIYFERNRSIAVPAAASRICCKISSATGFVQNPAKDCTEEILYLSDATNRRKHQSGISVANIVDENVGGRLLITGSYYYPGVGVCWV